MQEIERKFLVRQLPSSLSDYPKHRIEQGYLAAEEGGNEVRLRSKNGTRLMTVKEKSGLEREEHELELTDAQWAILWPLTAGRRLTKERFEVPFQNWTVELDVYGGANAGLVVAEVEFPSVEAARNFQPPAWLGAEITGRREFGNRRLAVE